MKVKLQIKIIDDNGEQFLGNGIVWLLEKIETFGSISKAAEEMNMSYSKSWKIIKKLEKNLGVELLIRRKGGYERGGTKLSPLAKDIVQTYNIFKNDIQNYSEKKFRKFFSKLQGYFE